VDAINADMIAPIDIYINVTAAGTLQLYHASETASQTSIMAGSCFIINKVI
jgi:hypothetical protein